MKPKMVEYHSGSSDINQSIAANVTTKINSTIPGPLSVVMRFAYWRSAVRSCNFDQRFTKKASVIQIAKKIMARIVKKGRLRYFAFSTNTGWLATSSASVQR